MGTTSGAGWGTGLAPTCAAPVRGGSSTEPWGQLPMLQEMPALARGGCGSPHSTTLLQARGSAPLGPTVTCWFPLKTLRSMLMKHKFILCNKLIWKPPVKGSRRHHQTLVGIVGCSWQTLWKGKPNFPLGRSSTKPSSTGTMLTRKPHVSGVYGRGDTGQRGTTAFTSMHVG